MSKYERAKLWVKRNQDKIVGVVIVTGFVGVMVLAVKSGTKYQEEQEIRLNRNIDDLNNLENELKELSMLEDQETLRHAKELA